VGIKKGVETMAKVDPKGKNVYIVGYDNTAHFVTLDKAEAEVVCAEKKKMYNALDWAVRDVEDALFEAAEYGRYGYRRQERE